MELERFAPGDGSVLAPEQVVSGTYGQATHLNDSMPVTQGILEPEGIGPAVTKCCDDSGTWTQASYGEREGTA
jgi:hypothetical protein